MLGVEEEEHATAADASAAAQESSWSGLLDRDERAPPPAGEAEALLAKVEEAKAQAMARMKVFYRNGLDCVYCIAFNSPLCSSLQC